MMAIRLNAVSIAAGWVCVALGVAVIPVWYTDSLALEQIVPGLPAMPFNSALCFIVAGAGLVAVARGYRRVAWIGVAWLLVIGTLTLARYAFDVDLDIDQLSLGWGPAIARALSERMDLGATTSFLLVGSALALLAARARFRGWLFILVALVCAVLVVAGAVLLGHTVNIGAAGSGVFARTEAYTAVGFIVLGAGLLSAVFPQRKENDGVAGAPAGLIAAWLVLTVALAMTLWAWYAVAAFVEQEARTRFDRTVEQMTAAIERRVHDQELLLIGARSLFAASSKVAPAEFDAYVKSLELTQRFPGVLGIGFAVRVGAAQRAAHLRAMRAEEFPTYIIRPAEARAEVYPIVLLERFGRRSRRILGDDLFAEPTQREAMERARDIGNIAVSRRTTLVQETPQEAHAGFLMYVPVYRGGGVPRTEQARRLTLLGFFFAEFYAEVLFRTLPELADPDIAVKIYDDVNAASHALLYDTDAAMPETEIGRSDYSRFGRAISLQVGDQYWLVRYRARPSFEASVPTYQPLAVLIGGLLVSMLLFGIVWSLATTQTRALAIAADMTRQLRDSERRYRQHADESQGLIYEHDRHGKLLYVNFAAARALGYSSPQLIGRNLRDLLAPAARASFDAYLARVYTGRDQGLMSMLTHAGEERVWRYDNALHGAPGDEGVVLGHAQDVTEMVDAQRALESATHAAQEQAAHDALTGLFNRGMFDEHLEREIALARRNNQKLALLFLDLDGFKRINDTLGHAAGDRLLQHVAERLRAAMRKTDVAARLGGDEFAAIVHNIHGHDDVDVVLRNMTESLRQPVELEGRRVMAEFSVGVALFPDDGATPMTLLSHADAAMYRVKREHGAARA